MPNDRFSAGSPKIKLQNFIAYPSDRLNLATMLEVIKREKNPAAVALGSMTSPAKAKAARKNGKLGGRPRTKGNAHQRRIAKRKNQAYEVR